MPRKSSLRVRGKARSGHREKARLLINEECVRCRCRGLAAAGHDVGLSLICRIRQSGPQCRMPRSWHSRSPGRHILLTHNRRTFFAFITHRTADHAGMVLCTFDADFCRQAQRIDACHCGQPRNDSQTGTREPGRLMPPRVSVNPTRAGFERIPRGSSGVTSDRMHSAAIVKLITALGPF